MNIFVNNLPKLIVACLIVISATVLLGMGAVSETAGVGLISAMGTYIVTNGLQAIRKPKDGEQQ